MYPPAKQTSYLFERLQVTHSHFRMLQAGTRQRPVERGVGREEYRAIVSRIRNYFRVALETALKKNISSRNFPRVSSPPPTIFHREIPSYLPPAFLKSSSPFCTIVNYRRQRDPAFHRISKYMFLAFVSQGMEKREDSSVVFPNTNLKNWKDFRVMRVEDEAYGEKGLESIKIFVWQG